MLDAEDAQLLQSWVVKAVSHHAGKFQRNKKEGCYSCCTASRQTKQRKVQQVLLLLHQAVSCTSLDDLCQAELM